MPENILYSPAIYRDMVIEAIPELESHMPREKAEQVARSIANKFCKLHRGKTYRIPKLNRAEKIARDKEIRAQAQTMSVKELAKKYELSVWWVREVLKGE